MMKTIHILCAVRDSWVAERLSREMADAQRCSFHIVRNGDAAMTDAQRFIPDILVIDAVLPNLDGLGVLDQMRAMLGDRMPFVIGGVMMPFAADGFKKRGVSCLVRVPWQEEELRQAIERQIREIDNRIDWQRLQAAYERACGLLCALGMRKELRGFTYLAWAAALAYEREARLYAVGEQLYGPVASRFMTTPQNVERLIRHALESTMDAVGADGIYGFFGNTIDPTRGKPTNAQMISMLVQRMRVQKDENVGELKD